jgi:hypothetical protein
MGYLSQYARRTDLFGQMVRRLDVDLERACALELGTRLQRIVRSCALCRSVPECAAWLAQPADRAGPRRFCPNADKFDELPHSAA